eukprot:Skav200767  [mRNA]  locus=scaffold2001:363430:369839:+ [translate_table: standard]
MQRFNPGPEGGKGSSSSPSRRRPGKDKDSPTREAVVEERRESSGSEVVEMSKGPIYHSPGSTPRSFEGVRGPRQEISIAADGCLREARPTAE